jgi:hypothetical protein
MRQRLPLPTLVFMAFIASAPQASADEIRFEYGWWGYTTIGDTGFLAQISLFDRDSLRGDGEIRSEHLRSRTLGTPAYPLSHYEFGSGMFTAELWHTAADGSVTYGTFAAPIFDFAFDLSEEDLFSGGNPYGDPGGHAVTSLGLGRGGFSAELADALHIHRETLSGEILLYIEGVGTPLLEPERVGVSSTQIRIDLVPEPPLTPLMSAGLTLVAAVRLYATRSSGMR